MTLKITRSDVPHIGISVPEFQISVSFWDKCTKSHKTYFEHYKVKGTPYQYIHVVLVYPGPKFHSVLLHIKLFQNTWLLRMWNAMNNLRVALIRGPGAFTLC